MSGDYIGFSPLQTQADSNPLAFICIEMLKAGREDSHRGKQLSEGASILSLCLALVSVLVSMSSCIFFFVF